MSFSYKNDRFFCEDVPIAEVAAQVGTPVYVYSEAELLDNLAPIQRTLADIDHLICYAVKANANPELLKMLAQRSVGADVVSGGELHQALAAGIKPERIVFAGVGKTDVEIRDALENNIFSLHVESEEELRVINGIAGQLGKRASLALRINPNIDIQGHPYITTGTAANKFGLSVGQARRIINSINSFENINLRGLHCHAGSQVMQASHYIAGLDILQDLREFAKESGIALVYLDIGGGFGVNYEGQNSSPKHALRLLRELRGRLAALRCRVLIEPGRALVASAGILVASVLFNKTGENKNFLVVDAGMNDLIRPSLYKAHHEILPIQKNGRVSQLVDVVGPICETTDFLALGRNMPIMARGDLIAILTAGAYGYSLASNYNGRSRPAEVLVAGNKFRVIRERERL